jgi:hypothetical protein
MIPRATSFSLAAAIAAVAASVVAGCSVAIGVTDVSGDGGGMHNQYNPDASDSGPGSNDVGILPGDGGVIGPSPYQGSPLCAASRLMGLCYPDDPTNAKNCHEAPDGGPYSATGGYDDVPLGCHVRTTPGGPNTPGIPAPWCLPAGSGKDGASCSHPADCAPGYECVGAPGTCQHYCCSGNPECSSSQFCDIQPTAAATQTHVPVCMPIVPSAGCTLLDDTPCKPTETCSVVKEKGETSCVAVGGAKVGEGCDVDHCARGLVCLGVPGARQCFQLCRVGLSDCAQGLLCKGGYPLFPNSQFGFCQ